MTPRGQPLKGRQLIILWVFCACLLQAPVVQGQEYTCKVEMNGTCITKVKWNIPERHAGEGKPFSVSYESKEGKTETAVVLHNLGHYFCQAAEGHTCDKANNSTYAYVLGSCVTGRNYSLAADGDIAPILCGREQVPSASNISKEISVAKTDTTDNLVIGIGVGLPLFVMAGGGGFLLYRRIRHCRKKEDHSELTETGKPMLPEKVKKEKSSEGDSKV